MIEKGKVGESVRPRRFEQIDHVFFAERRLEFSGMHTSSRVTKQTVRIIHSTSNYNMEYF